MKMKIIKKKMKMKIIKKTAKKVQKLIVRNKKKIK